MKQLLAVLVLVLVLPASLFASSPADWPHPRGPELDGRTSAPDLFARESIGLEVLWRVPLGSGYSGIAVAGERLVTCFSEGESDWVAAFDTGSGRRLWSRPIGLRNPGHDGSSDGPISSPVIGGGRVYALGADGLLQAVRLSDGEVVWQRDLAEALGGRRPAFGFGTTPLLEGEVLVVQAGGPDGRAMAGLDAATGETRWTHGDDAVEYQSPAVMTLAGRRQIVAAVGSRILGLAPEDGRELWSHALAEGENAGSAQPTFAGENRFLLFLGGEAVAFRLAAAEEGYRVEELYRSRALGGNYAPPVLHEGHFYGYRGRILACMDAATGEQVWRSRPPGGDGLLLVDDQLVIFGAQGQVVVAEASPQGYRERARVQAMEGSALTWPAFAGGRIYVRNLEHLAAVGVTGGVPAVQAAAAPPPAAPDHEFGRWLERARAAEDRKSLVDELLSHQRNLPIVEGEWVHFLFRGEAEDVALGGSMLDQGQAEPLERLPGTDLFHRSLRLEPGGRWEYRYQVDFGRWQPDPANPRKVLAPGGWGELSELVTAEYPLASHLELPPEKRGRLEEFTLASKVLGAEKKVKVWLPPGYDAAAGADGPAFPLLVVNDGFEWLEAGQLEHSLENLVGARVEPLIVALVQPAEDWWAEGGGSRTAEYVQMLAEELVPAVGERYRLQQDAASRAVLGTRFYGLTSALAALRHPQVFGAVAIQSPNLGLGAGDQLRELIRKRAAPEVRIYLDWERFGERSVDRGVDTAAEARELSDLLREHGYAPSGGEVFDSSGWGGWRNRTDRILTALFPASGTSEDEGDAGR